MGAVQDPSKPPSNRGLRSAMVGPQGAMARLSLTLLGGFQAGSTRARPSRCPPAKPRRCSPISPCPSTARTRETRWPPCCGAASVRTRPGPGYARPCFFIRKALGGAEGLLRQEGDTLAFEPAAVDTDTARFERMTSEGTPEALQQAAQLYTGDLLSGFALDEAPFEEWLVGERERLRELALEALARLLAHQRAGAGKPEEAVRTALQLLGLDPLQEPVHRTLMRLYVDAGRRGAALRQYQQCVVVLQRDLGIEPETETKLLYQEILRRRHEPPIVEETPVSRRLPRVAEGRSPGAGDETELIGRAEKMAELCAALESATGGEGRVAVV